MIGAKISESETTVVQASGQDIKIYTTLCEECCSKSTSNFNVINIRARVTPRKKARQIFEKATQSNLGILKMIILITFFISGNAVYCFERQLSLNPKSTNSLSATSSNIATFGNTNAKNSNNKKDFMIQILNESNMSSTPPVTTYAFHSSSSATSTMSSRSDVIDSNKTHGLYKNTFDVIDENRNGPYFDKAASKNVTALLGKTAYLNCRVKNLGNRTMLLQVSWVRHRDIHLLTVGRYTYTSDQRFRALHQPQTEDWMLQIKYPQHRDSGIYECQVSTTPHMSHYIHLNVVEPSTEIIGAPDLYIESSSTINLTCIILNSPEPPAYIFWNHNSAIINYDSPRGGVSVVTNKGEITTSFLLIKSARPADSGQYQCNPSNAKSKGVTVHVLNGEYPAAMQRAGQSHHHMSLSRYILVHLLICLSTTIYVRQYPKLPHIFVRT